MTLDTPATVDPRYRHVAKRSSAGDPIAAHGARLKWYELARDGDPAPASVAATARAAVIEHIAPANLQAGELGFAILHRCGADFYFLLVQVWRGANELWEAVYHCQGDQVAFTPFADAYPVAGSQRPTFCVWELGIVAAEVAAWTIYLSSPRTEEDARRYLETRFEGAV